MKTAVLLYVLFVGIVLLLLTVPVAGLLLAGYTAKQRSTAIRESRTRSGSGLEAVGELTDVQPVSGEASGTDAARVQLAVRFTGRDGQQHRAFLGVPQPAEKPYQVGGRVPLWLFPVPVIQPDTEALEPGRGADGKISGAIRFCSFMGKPVDETGTVMLREDYQAYLTESTDRLFRLERLSVRFYIAAGAAGFIVLCLLLGLFFN
ncbi:MAG: hypothetical protein K6E36_04645 [Oscillospiraceae bacterium]|nr:hypothetical protein [Oscillospiraceae bacterium]MCR5305771.1 hypothetical protein [Oscillospiraceae bacterium]